MRDMLAWVIFFYGIESKSTINSNLPINRAKGNSSIADLDRMARMRQGMSKLDYANGCVVSVSSDVVVCVFFPQWLFSPNMVQYFEPHIKCEQKNDIFIKMESNIC